MHQWINSHISASELKELKREFVFCIDFCGTIGGLSTGSKFICIIGASLLYNDSNLFFSISL